MKGIVFTGFLEMVEEKFGLEVTNNMIDRADPENGGAYTAIGTYDHAEMVQLIVSLHEETKIPVPDLIREFGIYFFDVLFQGYKHFFDEAATSFDLFERLEHIIHPEVKKLYPDAELPSFDSIRHSDQHLELIYTSERKMSDFAEGLILSCGKAYNEELTVTRGAVDEGGARVVFHVRRP